ncbi:MAG: cytidylate kinase family protein [Bacteroides sp.]|nr:cytidylate kinase family protein [Prevotella sp.]MCM1408203.1 cytidylate kinase family protein [Treponema brennaborense]MCM1469527.1 cytidylate kinase family protein [Bacteroides sp.]
MKYFIPDSSAVRVAISGKSGCGNTTVSTLLAERIGVPVINYTFRSLAAELGISLAQILEKAKTDDSFDIQVDTHQVEMARKTSCVLGSRLAIWMLKEADLKIYLLADDAIRAKRIQNREGGVLSEITAFTKMRDAQDTERYARLYNINNEDYSCADLVIDTALHVPEQIAQIIIDELLKRNLLASSCSE